MEGKSHAILYSNGSVSNGVDGVIFTCPKPRGITLYGNPNLATLKLSIQKKLKLAENKEVSRIIYRAPLSKHPHPLKYGSMVLDDDESVQRMIDIHSRQQHYLQINFIELYVYVVSKKNDQTPDI